MTKRPARRIHGRRAPAESPRGTGTKPSGDWIVLLEFASTEGAKPIAADEVQGCIDALREWNPSGLWHPDRYAVQLQVAGPDPYQALGRALACQQRAAATIGLPAAVLVRAEVFTVEELEHSCQDDCRAAVAAPAPAAALLCHELYDATRGLIAAGTLDELHATLVDFVTAIGGQVMPGSPQCLPGTADVDLSLVVDDAKHAIADSFSVAGLILEYSLPALVSDARVALARLGQPEPRVQA